MATTTVRASYQMDYRFTQFKKNFIEYMNQLADPKSLASTPNRFPGRIGKNDRVRFV